MRGLVLVPLLVLSCAGALAPVAWAQVSGGRPHDSAQPVQINADSLDVQQDQKIAVFKGNVDAVQGDLRLKADTLRVFYSETPKAPKGSQGGATGQGQKPVGGNTTINRLEAVGHVFVSRPDQTGKGDRGTYDLDKRVIVLEGNVVLTSGENVVKGVRATMDLNGKQSTVESGPTGRVQGLFQPKSNDSKPQ